MSEGVHDILGALDFSRPKRNNNINNSIAVVHATTSVNNVGISSDEDEDNDRDLCESFGRILVSVPPILERVLSHLPMKDLQRSCRVCRSFSDVGRVVKRRRQRAFHLFWAAKRRKLPRSVCSSCSITEHVRHVLDSASSEPRLGLVFVTNLFFEEQGRFAEESSSSDTPVIDYLVSILPRDCLLLGTCSSGMVGTTLVGGSGSSGSNGRACCVEVESTEGFSCLLLPRVTGMHVHPFVVENSRDLAAHETNQFLPDDEFLRISRLPADAQVKCLLLFCNHVTDGEHGARLLAHTTLRRERQQMALGGGFVDTFVAPRCMLGTQVDLPHTMGIAIYGERVRAASVVLSSSVRRRRTVEKLLERVKSHDFPSPQHSFGLMFACVGRGFDHYGEANVEADAFQKVFPHTPLFGFFGNGEIGVDFNPNAAANAAAAAGEQSTEGARASFRLPNHDAYAARNRHNGVGGPAPHQSTDDEEMKIFHGYTTIIVIVSVDRA